MKILVRLTSDLSIKSPKIRSRFLGRLVCNIEAALSTARVQARIERQWSRLFIEADSPRALDVLAQVYGVSSYSAVEQECSADLKEIVACGEELFRPAVSGKFFAVRARRMGEYGYTSTQLAAALGAALRPYAQGVRLDKPDAEVFVEVRDGRAYLYNQQFAGPKGLPLGVSGHAVCLLSGGFDSAVAAWFTQKRGVKLDYVFCNLAGGAYERSVLQVARFMAMNWSHGVRPYLHVVDFQPLVAEIRRKVKPSHVQIVLKRLFYRAAQHVAREVRGEAIITGECLAQVSSQTMRNLIAIEDAIEMSVFRPLLGFDKEEITGIARRIGSFALSSGIEEYCQLSSDKPATACSIKKAAVEEASVDGQLLIEALRSRRVINLKSLTDADINMPYLSVEAMPPEAVVIDCREREFYNAWHYPQARHIELHELLMDFRKLDKKQVYVLYCPVGLQSAVAAEVMQKAGYQAYSWRGGMKTLQTSQS